MHHSQQTTGKTHEAVLDIGISLDWHLLLHVGLTDRASAAATSYQHSILRSFECSAVSCMRLLDGARQCDRANIGRQFRELGLIKLVTATVQKPHRGMREDTPIALKILDRDLWIVPAVVQKDRR